MAAEGEIGPGGRGGREPAPVPGQGLFAGMSLEITQVDRKLVDRNWNFDEFNPFAKVYYVSEGEGIVDIAGKELRLRPGYLYLIPPYMPLRLRCESFLNHYWVHFMLDRFTGGALLDLTRGRYEAQPENLREAVGFFDQLYDLVGGSSPRRQMQAQGLLRLLLAYFLPEDAASLPARQLLEFLPTLEYIENNLDSALSNDELASMHNWHPTYFANRFSRALGISPRNFIIHKRVERARQLLWRGGMTIAEVAREVGFTDEYYFSRVFRKLTGMPPGRYQKEARDSLSHPVNLPRAPVA